ncbi:MAG: hypothetical protein KIT69_04645 [Propionibacteriaceae bacterium]|nr:hypothetical protein [Propionibacteriaceae bacterium]
MSKDSQRWNELPQSRRRGFLVLGLVDAGLRAWALADLAKRPQEEVRGPKAAWALALSLVSSVGILPAAYLMGARRRS